MNVDSIVIPSVSEIQASLARDDPCYWVEEILGEFLWSKQREILESVVSNRRTAVYSCHKAGKTWLAGRIACWWIETHPLGEAFVFTSAHRGTQVRTALWKEIRRGHSKGGLVGRTNQTEWIADVDGREEIIAIGRKPSDTDPGAFQGTHARYVLVIFDESCYMPEPLWDSADTLLANEDSRFLAIGNPDDPVSEFADVCKPGSGWNAVGLGVYDTPNFTDEPVPEELKRNLIGPTWVEEKKRKWGEDNPLYVSKVLGRFPEVTEGGLIPVKWIRDAQERTLSPSEPSELGMDVGAGGNRSVIAHRQGPVVRVVRRDTEPDTMVSCGNLIRDLRRTGAARAKVDYVGVGQGVVDRAKEQGYSVEGVRVGTSAADKESYANLRAEGFWDLRERFQSGDIDIDPDDDDLAAQLVGLRYKPTSSGKIQIESKEEMRRRGRASPDEADAVMLAFLDPPRVKRKRGGTWGRRDRFVRGGR